MAKYHIDIHTDRCTGCLRCQLACSDLYTKTFNPSQARLQVITSGAQCSIRFQEDCNACGTCADHCFYEALKKSRKELDT